MDEIKATFRLSGPDLTQDQVTVTRDGLRVGRTATNDLTLPSSQISRQHMRFAWQDGAFWVEDLESSNGVWLNGTRIPSSGLQPLKEGDVIVAGPFSLKLEKVTVPQASPPPAPEVVPPPPAPPPAQEVVPPPAVVPPAPPVAATPEPPPPPPPPRPIPIPSEERAAPKPRVIEPPEVRSPLVMEEARQALRVVPPTPPGLIPLAPAKNGHPQPGIPTDQSNWLRYLPAIYAEDEFLGRYLLIFESLLSP
ncbi:MAG: FHA domain-containing protein, partial [Chloroflexota bacterium]